MNCIKEFICSKAGKSFLLGVAATIVGGKVLKNNKTREVCVSGVAKAMKVYNDAQATIQDIKEDAMDICYDAQEAANAETEE